MSFSSPQTLGCLCLSRPQGRETSKLPVQAPTKYEMVINLKTAKRGITVPATVLARAVQVVG
jgi:putative tryptophan/tyrosine transport system substrate-binding protein